MPRPLATVVFCLMALHLVGCKACSSSKTQPKQAPKQTNTTTPKTKLVIQTPPERLARPSVLALRALKTNAKPVGKSSVHGPIHHIAMNQCAQGWVIAPVVGAESGPLKILEAAYLPKNIITSGDTLQIKPTIHPLRQGIEAKLEQFSNKHIKGTITLTSQKGSDTWQFDAPVIPLPAVAKMGFMGCYHTGHFTITNGATTHRAPATGIWERAGMYRMYFRLNARDRIVIWLKLPEHRRRTNEVIRADLAKVLKAPKAHNVRVLFERQKAGVPTIDAGLPAEAGKLQLAFKKNKIGGPIEITIKGLTLPKSWRKQNTTLPQKVDLKGLLGFTTDVKGIIVPVNPVPRR